MIELSIEDFILWVVGLPIVVIGLYFLLLGLQSRRNKRNSSRQLIRCRGCGVLFQDKTREKRPVCPDCGRKNDRGSSTKFG